MTDEDRARILELARLGWGQPRISAETGLPARAVAEALRAFRELGVLEQVPRGGTGGSGPAKDRAARDERARELRASGMSLDEVAAELGCGRSTVRRATAGMEVDARARRSEAVAERRQDAVALADEGLTTAEIAERLGVEEHVVRVDLRKSTEDDRHNDRRVARARRVAEARALAGAGRTVEHVAAELGVEPKTVRRYLGTYGNEVRTVAGALRRTLAKARRSEAVRLRDAGRSDEEIAAALGVSVETVPWLLAGVPRKR